MSDPTVRNNPARHRYEIYQDEQVIGFAAYRQTDGVIDFTHTEIDHAFEGHGYANTLARAMLNDVRTNTTLRVVASCPFVAAFIQRHPEYEDLRTR